MRRFDLEKRLKELLPAEAERKRRKGSAAPEKKAKKKTRKKENEMANDATGKVRTRSKQLNLNVPFEKKGRLAKEKTRTERSRDEETWRKGEANGGRVESGGWEQGASREREEKIRQLVQNKENLIQVEKKKQSKIRKDLLKTQEQLPIEKMLWEEVFCLMDENLRKRTDREMDEITREELILELTQIAEDPEKLENIVSDLLRNKTFFTKVFQFNE